ncbi:MAG: hypothetical protein U0360_04815 [Dehalococcoidia bacterium]
MQPGYLSSRRFASCLVLALSFGLLAACGGTSGDSPRVTDRGVVDKTGSSGVLDKTGPSGVLDKTVATAAVKAVAGTKKLPGSVCALLTAAEAEAVLKLGSPLVPTEGAPDPDSDRVCHYIYAGVAPAMVISLQGEREPLDLSSLRSFPAAKISKLNGGAEAIYWPSTAIVYVSKNGLAAVIQVVTPPDGDTIESAELKLAQPIANRLP